MLGTRASSELTGNSRAARCTLPKAARTTRRPAVEDRLTALQSSASACGRSGLRNDGRLVDRPGSGLRHHHAARRVSGVHAALPALCGRVSGFSGDGGNRGRRCNWRSLDFRRLRRRRFHDSSGRSWRFACRWRHDGMRLSGWPLFACNRRCRLVCRGRRLYHSPGRGRSHHNYRARNESSAGGSLGHHGACGRMGGNRWRSCGRGDDGRSRARLRNDPARGRSCGHWSCGCRSCSWTSRGRSYGCGRRRRGGLGGWRWRRRLCWHARVARLFFLFFLLGQNGLHHIPGLGDVREVDLRDDGLTGMAGGCSTRLGGGLGVLRKTRTNLLRLIQFQ